MQGTACLIYLHGFQSSAQSHKAQQLKAYALQHFPQLSLVIPDIPDEPDQAIAFLQRLLEAHRHKTLYLVGSSLGAYYALWLAQHFDCKAVLINPALRPYELLHAYLGEQFNAYTQKRYHLTSEHIICLKSLSLARMIKPENYLLLLQMADEVLEAGQASDYFSACRCMIEAQGNHAFERFEQYLPAVFAWLFME